MEIDPKWLPLFENLMGHESASEFEADIVSKCIELIEELTAVKQELWKLAQAILDKGEKQ